MLLKIAKFIGAFPMNDSGQENRRIMGVRCSALMNFYSWMMCLSYFSIALSTLDYLLSSLEDFPIGEIGPRSIPFVGYSAITIGQYLLMNMARVWPTIIKKWENFEDELIYISNVRKYDYFTAIIYIGSTMDHAFFMWLHSTRSDFSNEGVILGQLKSFILNSHPNILSEEKYSLWKGILICVINTFGTFLWTFMDVFIIKISNTLRGHLSSFNSFQNNINFNEDEDPNIRWLSFRRDYFKVMHFIHFIDKHLNKLVALTVITDCFYLINIFSSSINLLRIINPEKDSILGTFYSFSLCFLIFVKTSFMLNATASVHHEWKEAVVPLYSCSSHMFTQEAERLLEEILAHSKGLTVFNMFHVTRSLIFGVFGFLVSYEMLILSDSEDTHSNSTSPN